MPGRGRGARRRRRRRGGEGRARGRGRPLLQPPRPLPPPPRPPPPPPGRRARPWSPLQARPRPRPRPQPQPPPPASPPRARAWARARASRRAGVGGRAACLGRPWLGAQQRWGEEALQPPGLLQQQLEQQLAEARAAGPGNEEREVDVDWEAKGGRGSARLGAAGPFFFFFLPAVGGGGGRLGPLQQLSSAFPRIARPAPIPALHPPTTHTDGQLDHCSLPGWVLRARTRTAGRAGASFPGGEGKRVPRHSTPPRVILHCPAPSPHHARTYPRPIAPGRTLCPALPSSPGGGGALAGCGGASVDMREGKGARRAGRENWRELTPRRAQHTPDERGYGRAKGKCWLDQVPLWVGCRKSSPSGRREK